RSSLTSAGKSRTPPLPAKAVASSPTVRAGHACYSCRRFAVSLLSSSPEEPMLQVPIIRGVIDRRILVNFRVDPVVLGKILPSPLRPKLVNGTGIAGVCLIRLKHIRPRGLPAFVGVGSENAAHRIAVKWDEQGEGREGVFIPRRDTSSWLNKLAGGRLFPG